MILTYNEFNKLYESNNIESISIKWRSIDKLKDKNNIDSLFKTLGYNIPDGYRNVVTKYNAGHPNPSLFDTKVSKKHVFGYLLSFNKEDKHNIFKYINGDIEGLPIKVIPFATDPFGNLICFDYRKNRNPNIVYWLHENDEVIFIANNFVDFLNGLY